MTMAVAADETSGWIRPHADGCTLAVRIQPGAKHSALLGQYGAGKTALLKIAIQEPPIEGRANDALIGFLADTFHLPKSRVEILAGLSSRSKSVLLRGLSVHEAKESLRGR